MQKKKNHYHRYRKVKMGKNDSYIVYACAEPECSHYIRPELLIGKLAQCYHCRSLFTVSREQVREGRRYLKLHCNACTGLKLNMVTNSKTKEITSESKPKLEATQIDSFLSNLGLRPEN